MLQEQSMSDPSKSCCSCRYREDRQSFHNHLKSLAYFSQGLFYPFDSTPSTFLVKRRPICTFLGPVTPYQSLLFFTYLFTIFLHGQHLFACRINKDNDLRGFPRQRFLFSLTFYQDVTLYPITSN